LQGLHARGGGEIVPRLLQDRRVYLEERFGWRHLCRSFLGYAALAGQWAQAGGRPGTSAPVVNGPFWVFCLSTVSPSSCGRDRNRFRQLSESTTSAGPATGPAVSALRLVQSVHGPPRSSWRQWATVLSCKTAHRSSPPSALAATAISVTAPPASPWGVQPDQLPPAGWELRQTAPAADIANSSSVPFGPGISAGMMPSPNPPAGRPSRPQEVQVPPGLRR